MPENLYVNARWGAFVRWLGGFMTKKRSITNERLVTAEYLIYPYSTSDF